MGTEWPNILKSVITTGGAVGLSTTSCGKKAVNPPSELKNISPLGLFQLELLS